MVNLMVKVDILGVFILLPLICHTQPIPFILDNVLALQLINMIRLLILIQIAMTMSIVVISQSNPVVPAMQTPWKFHRMVTLTLVTLHKPLLHPHTQIPTIGRPTIRSAVR